MENSQLKIRLFVIGLDAYREQFAGLKEKLRQLLRMEVVKVG
jgi:hypothetical protein